MFSIFFVLYSLFILLTCRKATVIWYCLLNRQAEESIAKCFSQGHNNMTTTGFEPKPYRSKIARETARPCCRQRVYSVYSVNIKLNRFLCFQLIWLSYLCCYWKSEGLKKKENLGSKTFTYLYICRSVLAKHIVIWLRLHAHLWLRLHAHLWQEPQGHSLDRMCLRRVWMRNCHSWGG